MSQEKMHKNPADEKIIPYDIIYPVEIEHTKKFCDVELFFRTLKQDDEPMLEEFLYQLTEESAYQRFFQIMKTFPEDFIHEMVSLDYHEKMGIVGIHGRPGNERIVADAHWMLNVNDNIAEVAFVVADEFQRYGIGTHLLKVLLKLAKKRGIRGFEASVIVGNNAMMTIFKNSGCKLHTKFDSGMYSLNYYFDEKN